MEKKLTQIYKRIFIFICFYISILLSVYGSVIENSSSIKHLIDKNKVWEYRYQYVMGAYSDINHVAYFKMKFSGEMEVNGKTYSNLTSYDCADNNLEPSNHPFTDQSWLLREDASKIYISSANQNQELFPNENKLDEYILYDFTLRIGDSYEGLIYLNERPVVKSIKCIDVQDINVNGDILREFRLSVSGYEFTVLEGIGVNSKYGFLPYITPNAIYPGAIEYYSLMKTFDVSGNEIYNTCNNNLPRLISEDFIWEYIYMPKDSNTLVLIDKMFDGKEKIDGKWYNKFISIGNKTIQNNDATIVNSFPNSSIDSNLLKNIPLLSFLREEYGKIYLLNPSKTGKNQNKEILLYDLDFTKNCTSYYSGYYTSQCQLIHDTLKVDDIELLMEDDKPYIFDNEECIKYLISNSSGETLNLISGIGPLNSGMIDFPLFDNNEQTLVLNNIYDKEGNIVFRGFNYNQSYVDSNSYDKAYNYFNLLGAKITNPKNGDLLIQTDGKSAKKIIY